MPVNSPETRSEPVQDILEAIPSWSIRWGNTLILILLAMLLIVSWFVKYPDVISTQVMLTTENPPEKVYARSAGQLEAVLIQDGAGVTANTALAVIENTAVYQDVFLLKSLIDTLEVSRGQFYFPLEKLPILILGDLNSSFAAFENNYLDYQLNLRHNPFKNQSMAERFSLLETQKRMENLLAQEQMAKRELELKEVDLEREKTQYNKGYISTQAYERKEIELLQARRGLKSLQTSISQMREQINNTQTSLTSTEIEQSKTEIKLYKSTLQSYYQLKRDIRDWEKRYVLKSSIDGYVSVLKAWHEYQSVNSGDLLFTVVPASNQGYIGKIAAPAANSAKIKTGQQVQIKLANYPSEEFGELEGTVSSISLVANQEDQYLVDVALPGTLVTSYNKALEFKQEMKGTADIVTEDLRLIERFFYQLRGLLN